MIYFLINNYFKYDMTCCLARICFIRASCMCGFGVPNFLSYPKFLVFLILNMRNLAETSARLMHPFYFQTCTTVETMQSINLNIMINQTVLIENGSNLFPTFFCWLSSQDFIQSKNDSIRIHGVLCSVISAGCFWRILAWFLECF